LPAESWQALFNSGWRPEAGSIGLLSGEKPALEFAEQIVQANGSFWRVWGCAETGVWTAINAIKQPEDALLAGKPIDNLLRKRGEKLLECRRPFDSPFIVQPAGVHSPWGFGPSLLRLFIHF
jgi:hypothetical protein